MGSTESTFDPKSRSWADRPCSDDELRDGIDEPGVLGSAPCGAPGGGFDARSIRGGKSGIQASLSLIWNGWESFRFTWSGSIEPVTAIGWYALAWLTRTTIGWI